MNFNKKLLWPIIHSYKFRDSINFKNFSWGFISQNEIKKISESFKFKQIGRAHV